MRRVNEEVYNYYHGCEGLDGVLRFGLCGLCDVIPGYWAYLAVDFGT